MYWKTLNLGIERLKAKNEGRKKVMTNEKGVRKPPVISSPGRFTFCKLHLLKMVFVVNWDTTVSACSCACVKQRESLPQRDTMCDEAISIKTFNA